jgi:CheY-like chemotaxis protein
VVLVEDGRGALEKLQRERFDMILMDVRMPVMDGIEATKRIRGGEVPAVDPKIPIVALTAHALPGDRERLLAGGMDDYISKPIGLDELDRVLDRFEKE